MCGARGAWRPENCSGGGGGGRPQSRCTNTGLYTCQRFLLPVPAVIHRVRGTVSMDTVFLCTTKITAATQYLGASIITLLLFPDRKAPLVPLMRILFC